MNDSWQMSLEADNKANTRKYNSVLEKTEK